MNSSRKMQSAILYGPMDMRLEERAVPEVRPGTALLRVEACAICGSDLRIYGEGNARIDGARIIGHEISGEIVEIGSDIRDLRVGDRVSTGADLPCGCCQYCNSGKPNCCEVNNAIGYQFDGGFAQYMLIPEIMIAGGPLQKFGVELPWELASLAEPLACCINGYEQGLYGNDKDEGPVVIFGAGPIGLMLMLLGKCTYGATKLIVIEPSVERRTHAQVLGCSNTVDPTKEDPVARVMDLTDGEGARLVFTACPVVDTHEQAIAMIGKRGVVNFFGGLPETASAISIMSNHIHYKEAYITGSHGSTPEQHRRALTLIESGVIDLSRLITHQIPISDIVDGLLLGKSGKASKIIVRPNEETLQGIVHREQINAI